MARSKGQTEKLKETQGKEEVAMKPKFIRIAVWVIIGIIALIIIGLQIFSPPKNPLVPIGGAIEDERQMAAYNKAVDVYDAEMAVTTVTEEKSSSPRISKELLSTTSDFNFDDKVIKFKPGETEKIVQLEPGKTSPRIHIPEDKSGYVKLVDSTEVWCQNGIKYMDTPDARNKLPDRTFRVTGRQPVRIVLR
ncbi:MAG: hypothetical protein ABSE68_00795 [Minisyncoccia bacterium]